MSLIETQDSADEPTVDRPFSLVPVIVLLNGIVYAFWIMRPALMVDDFTVSWDALASGRVWTLVTSAFSHNMLWHLLLNMLVLRGFGSVLEHVLGRVGFLFLYVAAGIVGSLAHAVVSAFLLDAPELAAVGASGAIAGLILTFALLFPRVKLYLFGFIPMPALLGALAFVGLDVWGLAAQAGGGGLPIGHGAHLGGALYGAIYYALVVRPKVRGRRFADEIA